MWTLRAEIDHVDAPQMEMMCIPGDQIMVRPRQYTSDLPWARAAHSYPTCVGSVTSTTRSHIRIRMKIPVPSSCHEWQENTMSARTPAFRLTRDRVGCPRRRLVYRGKVVVRSESSCARPARRSFSNTDEPPARDHRRSADRFICCDVSRHDRSVGSAIDAFGGMNACGFSVFLYRYNNHILVSEQVVLTKNDANSFKS